MAVMERRFKVRLQKMPRGEFLAEEGLWFAIEVAKNENVIINDEGKQEKEYRNAQVMEQKLRFKSFVSGNLFNWTM